MMKYEVGEWKVTRRCCTSGNCACCRGVTPLNTSVRVEQGAGYSEAYAKFVAANWKRYEASAEPMRRTEIT